MWDLSEKLRAPIDELRLSPRANKLLRFVKIETVGQLALMTDEDLLKIYGFGKISLLEVRQQLSVFME